MQSRTTSRRKQFIGGFVSVACFGNRLSAHIVYQWNHMAIIFNVSGSVLMSSLSCGTLSCTAVVLLQWQNFSPVFRFLKLQPCGKNGYSPLHLAVDRNTTCVGRYPVCKFPSLTVASILLECGADVNSRDDDDNRSAFSSGYIFWNFLLIHYPAFKLQVII